MDRLFDLQLYLVDVERPDLRDGLYAPNDRRADRPWDYNWSRAVSRIQTAIARVPHKLHRGEHRFDVPNVFTAVCFGGLLARDGLHACESCQTLFIAKRPIATTCSDRCRQRLRERRKRTNRKRA
jgi:hypothetical protein